ncbi:ACP S-malonyltransferase [Alkaliphilus peptidifermentans]|uniref:[acyl-carrier-protein] S-malonyltransferase n=1 Tax=Alkaliphilus peptidifermentans DSM 18978 TaxID=1120976 RepID=A0A1G5I2E2_9FIRM|nr:ACP S-malonyltransferase [Alkaliphilus peptidifermentans]SCY70202.1 [acyl-carrier-protein] S-malonyltransferase [Alkaliphilus peptidifermentans DSM 18978]
MLRTALLFSGQGSQFIGMCKEIHQQYDVVKHTFEEASEALGFDLYKLCTEGDSKELTKTENAQPAVLTSSIAAYKVYMQEIGINPVYCAGHSLGEISALSCAGAIKFYDAVKLVHSRGKFMQEAVEEGIGAMSAIIGNDIELLEWTQRECKRYSKKQDIAVVSNYNSKNQLVISGHKGAIEQVGDALKARGAKVIPLKVSAPFHCCLMQPAAERVKDLLEGIEIKDLLIPVISNVDAKPYINKADVKGNIYRQMTAPVEWVESIIYIRTQGINLAFELGPRAVLKEMIKYITDKIAVISITDGETASIAKSIIEERAEKEKEEIKQAKGKLIMKSMAAAVSTRNLNYDKEQYTEGVIKPYTVIKQIWDRIQEEKTEPSMTEMEQVLKLLKLIFTIKKVSLEEQNERLKEILCDTGLHKLN